jgi:hypothetical protein
VALFKRNAQHSSEKVKDFTPPCRPRHCERINSSSYLRYRRAVPAIPVALAAEIRKYQPRIFRKFAVRPDAHGPYGLLSDARFSFGIRHSPVPLALQTLLAAKKH